MISDTALLIRLLFHLAPIRGSKGGWTELASRAHIENSTLSLKLRGLRAISVDEAHELLHAVDIWVDLADALPLGQGPRLVASMGRIKSKVSRADLAEAAGAPMTDALLSTGMLTENHEGHLVVTWSKNQ